MAVVQPSALNRPVKGSMDPLRTQVSMSSCPACTWNESGGSPPSIRVFSTALALVPAPPATVAFTIWTAG